jgi:hypothetical protein
MNHRAKPRLRYEPLAVDSVFEFYCINGTEAGAYAASFARDRINNIRLSDHIVGRAGENSSVEVAHLFTPAAAYTLFRNNRRQFAAAEIVRLFYVRLQYEMQICGINVAIGKHGVGCERRKRGNDAGLSRAAFAAYHDYFFQLSVSLTSIASFFLL